MFEWIKKLFIKPRRLAFKKVSYCYADLYLAKGWTIANEENTNHEPGQVCLELLDRK